MTSALLEPLTEMDYLAGETHAKTTHEFVDGSIHAMAGTSERHNTIAVNLFAACHAARHALQRCPLIADMRTMNLRSPDSKQIFESTC